VIENGVQLLFCCPAEFRREKLMASVDAEKGRKRVEDWNEREEEKGRGNEDRTGLSKDQTGQVVKS
jgi:hypothetical protein